MVKVPLTQKALLNRSYFQQGLARFTAGAATDTYVVAEAGTWGDSERQVSSFGKRQFCAPDACCQEPNPAAQVTEETGTW